MAPFFSRKPEPPYVSAVAVAFDWKTGLPVPLDALPVTARSIGVLNDCPEITEIVVVCAEEQIADYYDMSKSFGFDKIISVVKRDNNRQSSVFAGVNACSAGAEYFAVHDCLRPLVTEDELARCLDAAVKTGAAVTGMKVRDEIKVCDESGTVLSTPDRNRLWMTQSPQVFEAGLYRRAMAAALRSNRVYNGDCELVEGFGHRVVMSEGSYGNIRIDTAADIAVADAILNMEEISWHSFA